MKRIMLFFALLCILFSCDMSTGDDANNPSDPPVIVAPDGDPPELPTQTETYVAKLALYDGTTLRFWDGTELHAEYTGNVEHAGYRRLAIDNVLYWFDENATAVQSAWLPVVPNAITTKAKTGAKATIVYSDDVYTLEDIPPEEAYALGAMYRHYTRIFVNSVEEGQWYLNQWEVDRVITTLSGHILAQDVTGAWHNLTDEKNVNIAYDGGIMFYDTSSQHGYVVDDTGEYEITWITNFMDHNNWQLANDVWTSDRGFTWTALGGVVSNANELYNWNEYENYPDTYDAPFAEKPYTISAGVREENGEDVTYWIECVTGKLYRHIPSTDTLEMIVELYDPPMTRTGGWHEGQTLQPERIDDYLYYHNSGSVKRYNYDSGLVSIFSTDQQVISWE